MKSIAPTALERYCAAGGAWDADEHRELLPADEQRELGRVSQTDTAGASKDCPETGRCGRRLTARRDPCRARVKRPFIRRLRPEAQDGDEHTRFGLQSDVLVCRAHQTRTKNNAGLMCAGLIRGLLHAENMQG